MLLRGVLGSVIVLLGACISACGTDAAGPAATGGAGGTASAGASASGGVSGMATGGALLTGGAGGSGNAPTGGTGMGGAPGGGAGGVVAGGASGDGGAGGNATGTSRRMAAPPTYRGSVNNAAACSRDYLTSGFEPDGASGARYPLFLYFVGTNFFYDEPTFRQQVAPGADAVTEAMARRGFVALNVEYDNTAVSWLSDHVGQLACLFDAGHAASVLAVACALPQVDCNLGIATWGHSQGALVAHRAANYDPRVRASWLTGYGGDDVATLAYDRLRIVNGEGDTTNGQATTVNRIAGLTATECPDDGRSFCFRADGSGWVIVRRADCLVSTADHCWFDKVTCTDATPSLEPNWTDPASTKPFALELNADWVAATVRRP